jgi:60 kDa SS-A/Ro ribonucleoprotein
MVDRGLFATSRVSFLPKTDAINEAGGAAFQFSPQHAIAQYAATGCLSHTYYATAETQLTEILALAVECDPLFLAKTAVYARESGLMKDMPALLCAVLFFRHEDALLARIFPRVITTGKMLSNFVQIVRSGQTGRKSFGTVGKRLIQNWFKVRDGDALYRQSVGITPSMADIIKMAHPHPHAADVDALYAYLMGKDKEAGISGLPPTVLALESWKRDRSLPVPDVDFRVLASLELTDADWKAIARQATWTQTRMNLNTFARHNVFEDKEITRLIAMRLRNTQQIQRAKVFPYQILTAYINSEGNVPHDVREALHDAMEIATQNVPSFGESTVVAVCPDISASMGSSITGARGSGTSKVACKDVAALMTACIVRQNPRAIVLPFHTDVVRVPIEPRDSVMTISMAIMAAPGGGTSVSRPLQWLNEQGIKPDVVIIISDYESWADVARETTRTMVEWAKLRDRHPTAKLVCIDIQPYNTTQATDRADILNVGGFSDSVFDVVTRFAEGSMNAEHWIGIIDATEI